MKTKPKFSEGISKKGVSETENSLFLIELLISSIPIFALAFVSRILFPVNSANIEKIDVLRQFKIRRKNIGFIRTLTGKAARLKEVRK